MKCRVAVTLLVGLFSTVTTGTEAATGSVEYRIVHKAGQDRPAILLSVANRLAQSPFGSFAWCRVQEQYAQAYAGPTWTPVRNLTLGVAVGLEQNPRALRMAQFVSADYGKASAYVLQQYGGSGRYTKMEVGYRVLPAVKVGWLYETPLGSEGKVEFAPKRFPFRAWIAASAHVRQGGLVYLF